jgi:hypothetical protein
MIGPPGRVRRLLVPLSVVAVQLAAAYAVLGLPDLTAAQDFVTSRLPTMAGSVAAAQVTLWLALVLMLAGALAAAIRDAFAAARGRRRGVVWSLAVVVAGAVILAAGASHRSSAASVPMSGGSLQEARAEIAR